MRESLILWVSSAWLLSGKKYACEGMMECLGRLGFGDMSRAVMEHYMCPKSLSRIGEIRLDNSRLIHEQPFRADCKAWRYARSNLSHRTAMQGRRHMLPVKYIQSSAKTTHTFSICDFNDARSKGRAIISL